MIKKYRIKKNEEFNDIIAKKKAKSCDSFIIYYVPRKLDYSRVGISVPKKTGDAVVRNKIKRQVRMMLANFYDFDNNNFDIIIITKSKYLTKSFMENSADLEKLIKSFIM